MRLIRTGLLTVLFFVASLSVQGADFSAWPKVMPVTFSGYNPPGGGTLTNFPALVILSTNLTGFNYADFSSPADGADLRFAASNQTDELNYEIEKWDTNGSSFVWVQVPVLAGTNTQVWAFWGNPSAPLPACQTNGMTWSTDFRGVWHMQATNVVDATTNANVGAGKNGIVTTNTGVAGNALLFNHAASNYVDFGTGLALGTGDATLSIWFRTTTNLLQAGIMGKTVYAAAERYGLYGNVVGGNSALYGLLQSTNPVLTATATNTWVAGYYDSKWHQLTATYNRTSNLTLYVDGAQKGATNINTASSVNMTNPTRFLIGAYGNTNGTGPQTNYFFPGSLDEGRLMRVPVSSNWVWAAWLNAASNGTFNVHGPVEGAVAAVSATDIGVTNATLNGMVMRNGGVPAMDVYFCWDAADKGTGSTGDWAHVTYVGNSFTNGQPFAAPINGLVSGSTYVYRCYATNASWPSWSADARSFRTIYVPSVTNSGAAVLSLTTALLQGTVTDAGGETPDLWFLYWLAGDSLTNSVQVGAQTGACSAQATGLMMASNYVFMVMASNSAGVAYSGTNGFRMAWAEDFRAIPITLSGYGQSEVLTNFPVLVRLGAQLSGFEYAGFRYPDTGADLRFSSSNRIDELPYQIEKWDTNGTSCVWVQVPLVSSNTTIWASWGRGSAAAAAPAYTTNGAVWTNGFAGVWHLNESSGLSSDSTTNLNHAGASNGVVRAAAGMVGNAVSLDGVNDFLAVPHSPSLAVSNDFTAEVLVRRTAYGAFDGFISKSTNSANGWNLNFNDNSKKFAAYVAPGYVNVDGGNATNDFAWHHMALRIAGGAANVFFDGVQQSATSNVVVRDAGQRMVFGSFYSDAAANFLAGLLDEIRISSVPRSSNWLWASWANQITNSTFASYASVVNVLGLQALPATAMGATNATLNGAVTGTVGSPNAEISFCWGYADAGTGSTSDWPHVVSLGGGWGQGAVFSNALSGLLSGSTYVYRCYATKPDVVVGPVWSAPQSFTTVYRPSVTNLGPVNGYATTWLRGQITDAGMDTPYVWVYWWAEGGTTTNVVPIGLQNGAFSNAVTGLTPYTNYQYSILASNLAGGTWSSVSNFQTLITLPGVTNTGAQALSPFVAQLQGAVTNTGGDAPQVSFLYWLAGGATTNAYGVGAQTGACSAAVSGLLPGSNYVFMLMASNLAGAVYSGTNGFTTLQETIFYVATNGNNAADGLSWGTAVSNVEVGVQKASLCTGTVVIGDGNFVMASTNWIRITNGLTLRSLNGPTNTSLDAQGRTQSQILYVNHPGAQVFGLTMKRGNFAVWVGNGGPGALQLSAGLVSNCIFTLNKANGCGGAAYVTGGLLTDCLIYTNSAPNTGIGGGGVNIAGGEVANCIISNNEHNVTGSGIYMTGGRVRDSVIVRNRQDDGSQARVGCGVTMTGGTLERCIVKDHYGVYTRQGGGVFMSGGKMLNCVVANNFCGSQGGGIFITNAASQVIHCTVVGNTAPFGGAGIYMYSGSVSNSIVVGNGYSLFQSRQENVVNLGGTIACSASAPLPAGASNLLIDPPFVNTAGGDYRLVPGSSCIDAGAMLADVTNALGGTVRALDGDGDGSAVPDMGAYEGAAATSLACRISADTNEACLQLTAVLTATATGPDTNILWYGWDVDNNGTWEYTGADKASVTHPFDIGYYTVKLAVSNATQGAVCTMTNYIRVAPLTNYVARAGNSDTPPYDTWQKAASNLVSAVDAAYAGPGVTPVVLVSNGIYTVNRTVTLNTNIIVRSMSGPAATGVNAVNIGIGQKRAFYVDAPGAVLDGFMGYNANMGDWVNSGAGLCLLRGLVTNCVFTACQANYGGGAYVVGGLLVNSVLRTNICTPNGYGAGLVLGGGGAVLNCTISTNNTGGGAASGAGVYMTGGLLSNCVVRKNTAGNSANGNGGGIYMSGGTAASCVIADNLCYNLGGGVSMAGGLLRNCLLTSNTIIGAGSVGGGGIYMTNSPTVVNCTVCDNSTTPGRGDGIYLRGGSVSNSIVYFNGAANLTNTGGSVDYSCVTPLPAGVNNTAADPTFEDRAGGNYRLGSLSTLINAGSNQDWMLSGLDLDGSNRLVNGIVDLGAYERPAASAGEPLQCGFYAPTSAASVSLNAVFIANVGGDHTNNVYYQWDFGDSTGSQGYNLGTVSHAYGVGYYTVGLTVSNDVGEVTNLVRSSYIQVAPLTNYVALGAASIPPYESWAHAASNLEDAIDAGATTILLSNGTFQVGNTISILSDILIRSVVGPTQTILDAQNARQMFVINSSNAVLDGVTVRRASMNSWSDGGWGIKLGNGLVTNCIIENCSGYLKGAIWVLNGRVVNCAIRRNAGAGSNPEVGGMYVQGGEVADCSITSNSCVASANDCGGGIRVGGGTVRGCLIASNTAALAGGGAFIHGGSVANCTIVSNSAGIRGGGVRIDSGLLRNALVAGNVASNAGGIYLSTGQVENCTIVTNRATGAGAMAAGMLVAAGTGVNCIVYGNGSGSQNNVVRSGLGAMMYSCVDPGVTGEGNVFTSPQFRGAVTGNYHLANSSPCIDTGLGLSWTTSGTDYEGNPRLQGRGVDMGAFEAPVKLGSIFTFR